MSDLHVLTKLYLYIYISSTYAITHSHSRRNTCRHMHAHTHKKIGVTYCILTSSDDGLPIYREHVNCIERYLQLLMLDVQCTLSKSFGVASHDITTSISLVSASQITDDISICHVISCNVTIHMTSHKVLWSTSHPS